MEKMLSHIRWWGAEPSHNHLCLRRDLRHCQHDLGNDALLSQRWFRGPIPTARVPLLMNKSIQICPIGDGNTPKFLLLMMLLQLPRTIDTLVARG
jgi:hypothetical protein